MDLHAAAMSVLAATNPEMAKAITSLVKDTIEPLLEEFSPDYGYDALKGAVGRGMSEGAMSFPARPAVFDQENLNGTVLVKIKLDPPVTGSGQDIAGTATTAKFECGFYYKTPARDPETEELVSAKYMLVRNAGQAGITFDDDGNPSFDDDGDLVDLVEAMEAVAAEVAGNPPPGAKSLTRDPAERKRIHEQNQEARRLLQEQQREQEQQRQYQEQREADEAVYGSPEAFAQYLADQEETDFGKADLNKVLQTMFRDREQQAFQQARIKGEIEKLGYKFNPGKNHLSFSLRRVAGRLTERKQEISPRVIELWKKLVAETAEHGGSGDFQTDDIYRLAEREGIDLGPDFELYDLIINHTPDGYSVEQHGYDDLVAVKDGYTDQDMGLPDLNELAEMIHEVGQEVEKTGQGGKTYLFEDPDEKGRLLYVKSIKGDPNSNWDTDRVEMGIEYEYEQDHQSKSKERGLGSVPIVGLTDEGLLETAKNLTEKSKSFL